MGAEEGVMSNKFFPLVVVAALTAAGASRAVAGNRRTTDVTLTAPTKVGQQVMPAGQYRFSWTPGADPVGVRVTRETDGKVVAEIKAHVQQRPKAYANDEVVVSTLAAGQRAIEEVRRAGHKTVLVFSAS